MATTVKTLLNNVLRTLGETEVDGTATSLSSAYHKLVLTFLNQIKEEVEDAHNWRALRQTLTAVVPAGSTSAIITGANERSRLVRIQDARIGMLVPLAFDVSDAANAKPLYEADLPLLLYRNTTDTAQSATAPYAFALDNSAGDDLAVHIWPKCAADVTVQLTLIVPQDRLPDTDVTTVVKVPSRPIEMGTIWYALNERGEELGQSSIFSEERFRKSLDDAVSRDAAEQGDYELVPV